ncbi:ABI gene family member 3 isoform X1 [Lathamus discolor]|uniref:ABI gene family member 3 isoform X1 n=1 Tax=Lathamus discolor TaxID=678569 RepID=UPI0032B7F3E9
MVLVAPGAVPKGAVPKQQHRGEAPADPWCWGGRGKFDAFGKQKEGTLWAPRGGPRARPTPCAPPLQASDQRQALEETMALSAQSLASVSYQVSSLASAFLRLLDLRAAELRKVEADINCVAQVGPVGAGGCRKGGVWAAQRGQRPPPSHAEPLTPACSITWQWRCGTMSLVVPQRVRGAESIWGWVIGLWSGHSQIPLDPMGTAWATSEVKRWGSEPWPGSALAGGWLCPPGAWGHRCGFPSPPALFLALGSRLELFQPREETPASHWEQQENGFGCLSLTPAPAPLLALGRARSAVLAPRASLLTEQNGICPGGCGARARSPQPLPGRWGGKGGGEDPARGRGDGGVSAAGGDAQGEGFPPGDRLFDRQQEVPGLPEGRGPPRPALPGALLQETPQLQRPGRHRPRRKGEPGAVPSVALMGSQRLSGALPVPPPFIPLGLGGPRQGGGRRGSAAPSAQQSCARSRAGPFPAPKPRAQEGAGGRGGGGSVPTEPPWGLSAPSAPRLPWGTQRRAGGAAPRARGARPRCRHPAAPAGPQHAALPHRNPGAHGDPGEKRPRPRARAAARGSRGQDPRGLLLLLAPLHRLQRGPRGKRHPPPSTATAARTVPSARRCRPSTSTAPRAPGAAPAGDPAPSPR